MVPLRALFLLLLLRPETDCALWRWKEGAGAPSGAVGREESLSAARGYTGSGG